MKTHREPARDIPVAGEYDVVVAGGGCAGLAAAIASARNGARTLIVEQFPYFGGTATASLMGNINGFRNQVEPDGTQTVKGIGEEVIRELHKLGGLGKSPYPQKDYDLETGELAYSYAIDTERFKYVTLRMMVDAGADILFHTWIADSIVEKDAVRGIVVENKSGRQAILGRVVVDATGDADVVARAGGEFWQVRHSEAPRLSDCIMYRVAGVAPDSSLGSVRTENGTILWGPGGYMEDATDAVELTKAEVEARLKVYEHFAGIREKHTGLDHAYVAETPALLGIRQTRFVEGVYKLTAEDAIEGRRFDDVVSISSCAIIHYYGYRRYLDHEGFDIPWRSLVPKRLDGLVVAGRPISSEQQPYESYRAMAPILAIGEAAGTGAALAAKARVQPRDLAIEPFQRQLVKQGAEIRKSF